MRRLRRLTEGLINALRVDEVVQVILGHGFDSIPELSVGAINLLTEDGVALRIAGTRGAPSGLVLTRERVLLSFDTPGTRSARTGEAVWLPTREAFLTAYPHLGNSKLPAEMVQAIAAIPLQVERRVLGTLALTFRRPQSFALEEREFFLTLGRLCAQALDRARLYEEERSARYQLAAAATRLARLQRLTAALSEGLTPLDIARVVVEEASMLLGADQALLMVPSEDGRNLLLLGHHGLAPEVAERWAQVPTTAALPAATAYQICVPLWLESPEDLVEHYPRAAEAGLGTQALACVPLLVQGSAIGVIGFGFRAPRRFIEEDRALLGDLARQTAQALERARLYDAEQRPTHGSRYSPTPRRRSASTVSISRRWSRRPHAWCLRNSATVVPCVWSHATAGGSSRWRRITRYRRGARCSVRSCPPCANAPMRVCCRP